MAAYTTIDDPSAYFKIQLYTGTGSSNAQTFADTDTAMQPDMVWIKSRSDEFNNMLYDSVRGVTKHLKPDGTNAEATDANALTAFGSDGFTVGSNSDINNSSDTYVAWCWNTQGGAGSSNTSGSINTTTTSVGATQGVSISTYTGTGSAATLGHGLGAAPQFIMVKNRGATDNWTVFHSAKGNTHFYILNQNASPIDDNTKWNDTSPTSTLFTVGTDGNVNRDADTYVAYAFAPVQGFSKFGSYIGNGSTDGTFIYTGFRPAYVLIKIDGDDTWHIFDNKRDVDNVIERRLEADNTSVEHTTIDWLDFTANGFKQRYAGGGNNNSGTTYIYAAFAEQPFVNSNGVPCNAR